MPNEVVDTHEQMKDVPAATLLTERNESGLVEKVEQVDLNLSIDSTLLVEEEGVPNRVANILE